MSTRSRIPLALLVGVAFAATIAGCQSTNSTTSRPQVAVDEPIATPPLQVEEVPIASSTDEVWIPGYWERDPGEWAWVNGRWEKPPAPSARWEAGHWQWLEGRWRWIRGDWVVDGNELVISDEMLPIPAPKFEVITAEPSKDDVWVPGSWERDPGQWTWTQGHWAKPPNKKAHWQPGHWKWHQGRWEWVRAQWATSGEGWIVDDVVAVPPLPAEKKPPKPSDMNHWVPGYWEWDGKWIWIPGYWTVLTDPHAAWVAGHWDEYGAGGEWRWIAGHWSVS